MRRSPPPRHTCDDGSNPDLAHLPTAAALSRAIDGLKKGAARGVVVVEGVAGHCNYDKVDIAPCGSVAVGMR